jgi:hypothetical protein
MMRVKETLKTIIKKLKGHVRFRTIGTLLSKSLETRPLEYKEFNFENRNEEKEVILDSLINAIKNIKKEELNTDAKNFLENFPQLEQKNDGIDTLSEESKLIQTFEDVVINKRVIKYDDPTDILSTLLKMSFDESVLYHFLKRQLNLRDQNDFNEVKKSFFKPFHNTLKEILGERFKDILYFILFKLSRLYGVPPLKKMKAEDVYIGGYSFYKNHENEFTITFSTSSGLPNPLERFGNDEYVQRYSIPEKNIGDILLKNPYRMANFSSGILNQEIDSRRIYIWEKNRTSQALKEALAKVPNEKKQNFIDDAVELLKEALLFEKIKIIEIGKFDGWMRRFTRNAENEIMLSIRGNESKRISHAININFDISSMDDKRNWVQRLLNVLSMGVGYVSLITAVALVFGEDLIYSALKSSLKKPFNFEKDIANEGKLIKDYSALEPQNARIKAEEVIEGLLTNNLTCES